MTDKRGRKQEAGCMPLESVADLENRSDVLEVTMSSGDELVDDHVLDREHVFSHTAMVTRGCDDA